MKAKKEEKKTKDELVTLAPLDFETALESLLQVKPVENSELKKNAAKKKQKPTKK